jgi:hypothetical protein
LKGSLRSIRPTGQPDLTATDLNFLELYVLSLEIRCIAQQHHRIAVSARPLDINAMAASILDDSVENGISGDRQDPGPDFLQRQLDGISLRHAGTRHHGDHRGDPALVQLKGKRDPIQFEQDARFVHFRWKLVGEMGH